MASFFYLQILKVKKDISCLSKASAVCLGPLVIVSWNTWGRLFISEGCLYSSQFSGLKSILGMRPDLRCACYSSWDCTGENWFCLCWRVSMACSFLVRGGSLCPLPALSTGALSLLNLCRPCAWNLHLIGQWLVCAPKPRWKKSSMGLYSAAFPYCLCPVCLAPAVVTLCLLTSCVSTLLIFLAHGDSHSFHPHWCPLSPHHHGTISQFRLFREGIRFIPSENLFF